jgi:OOP family OmpA-OmpF porin
LWASPHAEAKRVVLATPGKTLVFGADSRITNSAIDGIRLVCTALGLQFEILGSLFMKKTLAVAAALIALPVAASQAQTLQYPGFYAGVEAGGNYMFNTTVQVPNFGSVGNITPAIGYSFGGMVGYDFVGPRAQVELLYNNSQSTVNSAGINFGATKEDIAVMADFLYDFNAGGRIVPYVGVGAGVAFTKLSALGGTANATEFAYQGIVGVGYNIDPVFRVNLEGRYFGTTNPTFTGGSSFQNNNILAMLQLQVKFGAPSVAVAAPVAAAAAAPSFIVFFDWDRSNLSAQALATIKQAADSYKTKGSARITATGHTDKSGPDDYNMALSLRRAATVKDALVRDGVPAGAIATVGRGESQPLVQTADGVREPQNRRVEIVIQ